MRAHIETILAEVEARPDTPEAGVAHRGIGVTHWFAGEYREARDHLEHALALFEPGRDDDLAFRFGHDAGVVATLHLAFALWPIGDVVRAVSLVRSAEARASGLAHLGTNAFGRMHVAMFELMRGDFSRAAPDAVELARLAGEHDLPFWRAYGVFLEGMARAESGAPSGGLEAMRRGAELLRQQNVLVWDGLIKIALAEAEARAGDRRPRPRDPRRRAGDVRTDRSSRVRRGAASRPRRNAAEARPRRFRARRGSPPDRHRRRETAGDAAASNCARRSRSPNSINRPPVPSKPTPSSRPRSKAFRRRRKCLRSLRRRRCWGLSRPARM